MKIDIFTHVVPSGFKEALNKLSLSPPYYVECTRSLFDLDLRFRIMDKYDGYVQVITVAGFHKVIAEAGAKAVDLAKMVNDEMAELVSKYPDRFVAAVACLPLNHMDAALKEADRAINELRFRGVEIWAGNARPLDLPEYMPLYEEMCRYNLPIWIHPVRTAAVPDYSIENESKYGINSLFGWVYETTTAMTRLVFSRVLKSYPDIKFITHHCGAMVPYLAARIVAHYDNYEMVWRHTYNQGLTKHPIEYFRMFYADTALNGNPSALTCGYDFFGVEHLLFATDMPMDSQLGHVSIRETIRAIEEMDISVSDKKKIYEDNARKLLRLPV